MTTFTKIPFSGSTDGRGIAVAATAIGSGTTIHTAQASGTTPDVVTIYAYNLNTTIETLVLGWGSTADPDLIVGPIPVANGLTLVVADLILRNTLIVKAATTTTNKVSLFGYVNRIS